MMVYIKKINKKLLEREIKQMLAGIRYVPKRGGVFIKPNICGFHKSYSPCIVNPRVVGGVIEYLRDLGGYRIIIGESPVSYNAERVFTFSGYRRLADFYGVELVDLSQSKRREVSIDGFKVRLPVFLLDNEMEYINIAKMKTHILTSVTLCTKNQKGLIEFGDRRFMHICGSLHDNIKSLLQHATPDFCIIDALNPLEGDGPGRLGKEVKNMNLVVMGYDIREVDWVGAQIMGIDPVDIKHLIQPEGDIEVKGEAIEDVKRYFMLPKGYFSIGNLRFWVTDKTCSACTEVLSEFKKNIIFHPIIMIKFVYKLLTKGINILSGGIDPSKVEPINGVTICFGRCMREHHQKYGQYYFIDGCPPSVQDLLDVFRL